MERTLRGELVRHFRKNRQMAFLSGPRQVGKTTLAKALVGSFPDSTYLNWDNQTHRALILKGPDAVAAHIGLDRLLADRPLCAFDELHKYQHWRTFLKGLFDLNENRARFLVTGSVSLETFRRGGDSLMGRYFPYRLHPLSVGECLGSMADDGPCAEPAPIDEDRWQALWRFGGFPEPFLKASQRFHNRWRALRREQLFREDLRDLTRIQELGQIEMLAELMRSQVGRPTSYSHLARTVQVSVDTAKRWVATLGALYFCFTVKPWHKNVARALRKEPKHYLWDWSEVAEAGPRAENLVASALRKSVQWWTETGRGDFGLHFVRDKQKREVDFLVTRDQQPWFLVEVKASKNAGLSGSLGHFQRQTGAQHAFQAAMDADFLARDCFTQHSPIIVPARTLLAQLA